MGQEKYATLRRGNEKHWGKALLETSEIIFRGETLSLRIPFTKMKMVKAAGGELRIETGEGLIALQIGPFAEKWQEKILHPKTRIEKLGVKAGAKLELLGEFEAEFLKEVKAAKAKGAATKGAADWIFLALEGKKDLGKVARASKRLKGAAGLWIVYPKGKKELTETDVIGTGRKAGLKDVKVVGFSTTHTALKFVIPVDKR